MLKKILACAIICALSFATHAQENVPPPPIFDLDSLLQNLPREEFTARVRLLNKRSTKSEIYTLKSGTLVTHNSIQIVAKTCLANHQEEPNNHVGWLEVRTNELEPLFSGWMYSKFPGVSTLEHPVYSLQLIDCRE